MPQPLAQHFCQGVILKPCGPIFGQIWPPADHFTKYEGYGLMWTFREPPSPLAVHTPHGLRMPLRSFSTIRSFCWLYNHMSRQINNIANVSDCKYFCWFNFSESVLSKAVLKLILRPLWKKNDTHQNISFLKLVLEVKIWNFVKIF